MEERGGELKCRVASISIARRYGGDHARTMPIATRYPLDSQSIFPLPRRSVFTGHGECRSYGRPRPISRRASLAPAPGGLTFSHCRRSLRQESRIMTSTDLRQHSPPSSRGHHRRRIWRPVGRQGAGRKPRSMSLSSTGTTIICSSRCSIKSRPPACRPPTSHLRSAASFGASSNASVILAQRVGHRCRRARTSSPKAAEFRSTT